MNKSNNKKSDVCLACSCPCDMHKKHTHGKGDKNTCSDCGHAHQNGGCDCGCK